MNMSETQDEFLRTVVDSMKRDYLKKRKDFSNTIFAFHEDKVTIIPFQTRDQQHKQLKIQTLAAAFAARGIKRYAYFIDSWMAVQKVPERTSFAEAEQHAQELYRRTPGHTLENHPEKKEAICWGMIGEGGRQYSMIQMHDSKKHQLLDKPISSETADHVGGQFGMIMAMGKMIDWTRSPIPKSMYWSILGQVCEGTQELDLRDLRKWSH